VIKIGKVRNERFKEFTCPTCNAGCVLLVEVKNNEVISVRPNKRNPISKGYCCPKGISHGAVTNDKDRVLRPLKRDGAGFKEISWKHALQEIVFKLKDILKKYSPDSVAYYMGTNSLHQYAHGMFAKGFLDAIGSKNMYNAGSVDNNNKFVAQYFLYGSSIVMSIPDLPHSDMFIIIGSNPAITNLSLACCSNVKRVMKDIQARGGEIYVIDPRRNETARLFTTPGDGHYIPIHPDTDAFLLLSMINLIFEERLEDREYLISNSTGHEAVKDLVQGFTPELVEKVCHIPAEAIRSLMRKFVQTKRAVIYGRLGTCLSTFSTLNAWAIEVLNIIARKLDRPGGAIFGKNVINISKLGRLVGMGGYASLRSRVDNYPDVMGAFPLGTLAREMLAEKNPVRALFVSGGNPILSSPNSSEFERALQELELCVVLDFYINETAVHAADYILPVRTPLENSNIPIFHLNYQLFPHVEYTKAVIVPDEHGPKPEWEILLGLVRLLKVPMFGNRFLDLIPKVFSFLHKKFTPDALVRIFLFLGQVLEKRFPGLSKEAITFRALKKKGMIQLGRNEYGVLKDYLRTKNKKINLLNAAMENQIIKCRRELEKRLKEKETERVPENEFVMIGRRDLKTMNSWLHNIKLLWRNKEEPRLFIHPGDADRLHLTDDEVVRITTEFGSIAVPIRITDEVMPGVLCYPHGWGHDNPRLSFAAMHPGKNINYLTNSLDLEELTGMPRMNGYKVHLQKLE